MKGKWRSCFFFFALVAVMLFAMGKMKTTVLAEGAQQEQTTIAEAFQQKNLSDLYENGKLVLSDQGEMSVKYSKSADGLLANGTKEDLANTVFTFTEPFDFSEGVIGRLNVDALAAKGNQLKICFYLDDETESFAEMDVKSQKREGKWYVTNQSISIYDKKISGEHTISFRVVQTDEESQASFVLRTVTFAKSTVPVMYFNIDEMKGSIDAMNNSPEHDAECYGDVTIEIPDGYQCEYADADGNTDNLKTETYELEYIRGRGNSTWMAEKKPYKMKFAKKQNLFNMGKNKHWVLLADYYDPTHMRNKATYWIGQQLGMEYTPECVYVDVVMNGEYYGSYLLSEQVRLDSQRVDLDNLEDTPDAVDEPTITGGYLLSMSPDEEEPGKKAFSTSRENSFLIESPTFEEQENEAQYNYIKNYVQKTEDAIYDTQFQNEGTSYREYMDVTSAAKYYWIQEFSANGDGFISNSSYLYKKRNDKLYWGPLWDFDYVAWGNNDYGFYECENWWHKDTMWFAQLFKDDVFSDEVIKEWESVKDEIQQVCKDGGKLDQYADEIAYSMNYNADLYGNNYDEEQNSYTFDQNVEQLKQWMTKRTEWVDENISQLKAVYYTVTFKDGKKTVETQKVFNGDTPVFPKLSTKKGYVFGGWYAKDDSGETYLVDNSTSIYEDMILYARWVAKKDIKPIRKIVLGYNSIIQVYEKDLGEEDNMGYIPYGVIGGSGLPGQIVWSTSDDKVIVPLEDGQFQMVGIGDAVLTAASKDGKVKAKCKIHVTNNYDEYEYASDMELNKKKVHLKKGESLVLETKLYPNETANADMTWTCSDDTVSIEEVGNKCIVHAKKNGTAQIVAVLYGEEGLVARCCTVNVGDVEIKPGSKVTRNQLNYTVISMTKSGGTVRATGIADKKHTKVTIPSTITINKKKYKVVSVGKKAFAGNKNIRQITIGKNVTSIGERAFSGCKKLWKVTFKGSKTKKIGKKAFSGTASKVTLVAKKADRKRYQKLLRKAGVKKVVVKK